MKCLCLGMSAATGIVLAAACCGGCVSQTSGVVALEVCTADEVPQPVVNTEFALYFSAAEIQPGDVLSYVSNNNPDDVVLTNAFGVMWTTTTGFHEYVNFVNTAFTPYSRYIIAVPTSGDTDNFILYVLEEVSYSDGGPFASDQSATAVGYSWAGVDGICANGS